MCTSNFTLIFLGHHWGMAADRGLLLSFGSRRIESWADVTAGVVSQSAGRGQPLIQWHKQRAGGRWGVEGRDLKTIFWRSLNGHLSCLENPHWMRFRTDDESWILASHFKGLLCTWTPCWLIALSFSPLSSKQRLKAGSLPYQRNLSAPSQNRWNRPSAER